MSRKKDNSSSKMRISTVIKQLNISPPLAAAALVKHNLKYSNRVEPEKFLAMVDSWRKQPAGGK